MTPSLDEVIWIIRDIGSFSEKDEVGPSSTIQEDLGLEGDDGWEILETIWERFGLRYPENEEEFEGAFGIEPGQILFLPEGSLFAPSPEIITLFGPHPHHLKTRRQRVITVAELYAAVLRFVTD